jgi:putative holliday junction resolvase
MSKILALDYGTKNIGLAISDNDGKVALPYHTITLKSSSAENMKMLLEDIKKLVETEEIERIVLGMPYTSSGDKTKLGDKIFEFSKKLEDFTATPVDVEDERLTSKLAEQLPNKNSRNIHELSAQILLQDFLDRTNG